MQRFDLLRIDHFRGLAAYWSVPAGASTAREGRWVDAPGAALLARLRAAHGGLPVVAEDLGLITPDVEALRREFDLPGMRVLQFGFDGSPDNPHLAHNYTRFTVVYTGTHDNDTTLGWYRSLDASARRRVEDYLGCASAQLPAEQMPTALLRAALASVAVLAVAPLQDLLGLGSEARFNTPGTVNARSGGDSVGDSGGNWSWQFAPGALTPQLAGALRAMNERYGRVVRYPLPP